MTRGRGHQSVNVSHVALIKCKKDSRLQQFVRLALHKHRPYNYINGYMHNFSTS